MNGLVLRESYLGLALCQESMGAVEPARATLTAASRICDETPGFDPNDLLGSMRSRLGVLRGEPVPVEPAESLGARRSVFERSALSVENRLLTRSHVLLASGDFTLAQQARLLSEELVEQFEDLHDCPGLVAALVVNARALCATGDVAEGINALGRALSLATPGRMTWPFVEHESALRTLLPQVSPTRADERAFRDHLLQLPGREDSAQDVGPIRDLPVAHLTWREIEVLGLVAQHLANKEIAALLVISPETVKRHVVNICRKLQVRSRRAAVGRARQLGLLT
jgi:LuxR family maltose regulon positive regulatory protein